MEITDVKVIPVDDEKLKAFVSIVFDQSFVVTDIKIINGPKGLFVSMPSKKRKDGTFKDIAHPLNNQMRQYLEEKVLIVYRQQLASAPPASSAAKREPAVRETGDRPTENPPQEPALPVAGSGSEGNGGSGGEAPQS
jgi:stage V sporulation protein G